MNQEILYNALENLEEPGGIYGKFEPEDILDGNIVLHFTNRPPLRMLVEIKKELRQHQLPQLIEKKRQYGNFMLVAEKLHPTIKKQLQQEEIAYLEESGNIFIKTDDTFLLIDTNKPIKNKKQPAKKAFTKTNLKLVFNFLLDPGLINSNQRTIAKKSGVSLGTVPKVINILKEEGFLILLNKKYLWENREGLLTRWINDYDKILKPKLYRAVYDMRKNWKEIQLTPGEAAWGGEPAADLLTGYLRPEEFVLFSNESSVDMMKNYHLKPNKNGDLIVYEKFWENESTPTAPPLLVYTDLILKEDKRCRETAKMIFDEYIRPVL
ncbi:MAG: type IV toxin-antitoxin system AbiEi family antitoxin [Bacteroidota bacterium]